MSKLFDGDSDSELDLKTETDYAKNYNSWRQKEELHKLQARYGDISSSSESSSDEDEDEQPDENFDKDFFKTLSYLKNKDERIYNKNFDFFAATEPVEASKSNRKKKEQPMFIKDYERKIILEKGGQLSDEEDENNLQSKPFTYNDEQNELKENLKTALDNIGDDDAGKKENWGGLFKTREKTILEKEKEDDDYLQWLAGQSQNLKDKGDEIELKPLQQFWNDPKLEGSEKFLRDYILKKRFLESADADQVPTYDEIIHDSDKEFSEDEKAIEQQEEFEHKYNFRFEEPDQEFIKRYPRTLENSLRQKDDKRKVKRLERRERKTEEKQQKMQEINKLKEFKKKEIEEKLNKLKEITGNTEIAFDVKDFEDDFDPDEHDKRMQSLFNEEFYQRPEGEQKPEFPDLDEELDLENWDRWHGKEDNEDKNDEPHCEDENFNMDCDYNPADTQQELIDNTKRKKKRRRKSKFAKVISEPKPVFDPSDRTYQEYLDEYYKLDCEDIIGDIPCRFKYRRVIPNDFGLSVEEILSAKDKELNRWCSLKRALQHRPEHVEKYDIIAFSRKGQNTGLKKKYLPSLFETVSEDTDIIPTNNTTDIIPKEKHSKKNNETITSNPEEPQTIDIALENDAKRKRSKKKNKVALPSDGIISDTRNQTETVINDSTGKKKKKKKKAPVDNSVEQLNNAPVIQTSQTSNNKKRKHKQATVTVGNEESGDVSKHKRRKHGSTSNRKVQEDIGITDARLAAYGFKPKKFKNKLKYGS